MGLRNPYKLPMTYRKGQALWCNEHWQLVIPTLLLTTSPAGHPAIDFHHHSPLVSRKPPPRLPWYLFWAMGPEPLSWYAVHVTLLVFVLCFSLGAGPEVLLALASMAMGRLPTSYHCRRIPRILHRGFGDRGLHPGTPGPRRHLLLSRAIGHQPISSPTANLSTRVTVALALDCHLLRLLSTSCPWLTTKAILQRRVSSTDRNWAATMVLGPTGQLKPFPSICDQQQSPASGPIGSTNCATPMWVRSTSDWAWRQLIFLIPAQLIPTTWKTEGDHVSRPFISFPSLLPCIHPYVLRLCVCVCVCVCVKLML
jgi:hypothetical protein